jgi:hypothetical protein
VLWLLQISILSRAKKRGLSPRIRKDKVDYGCKKVLSVSPVLIMVTKSEISFFIVLPLTCTASRLDLSQVLIRDGVN